MEEQHDNAALEIAVRIISAYVSNNSVPASELSVLIYDIYGSILNRERINYEKEPELKPAVSINKSITRDYIICLEDGKKFKSLKRHLRDNYAMTPDEYRTKWGLPDSYPVVAPSFSEARSRLAKEMGLGRPAAKAKKKPARRRSARSIS